MGPNVRPSPTNATAGRSGCGGRDLCLKRAEQRIDERLAEPKTIGAASGTFAPRTTALADAREHDLTLEQRPGEESLEAKPDARTRQPFALAPEVVGEEGG